MVIREGAATVFEQIVLGVAAVSQTSDVVRHRVDEPLVPRDVPPISMPPQGLLEKGRCRRGISFIHGCLGRNAECQHRSYIRCRQKVCRKDFGWSSSRGHDSPLYLLLPYSLLLCCLCNSSRLRVSSAIFASYAKPSAAFCAWRAFS